MANTLKTLSDGDLVRKYLASFHNQLKFIKTINRQYDSRFAVEGAKNGGTLLIKDPNQYVVTTGAVMDVQDIVETTQSLTVATQKHIAVNLSSLEWTLSVDDFEEMHINPAMSRLAADVEYTVLAAVYKNVFNMTGASGMASNPATLAAILNAGVKLSQGLAPTGDRSLLLDSVAMAGVIGAMGIYFHPASTLEKAISDGFMGRAGGFDFYESNMVPRHTNGTRTDTTPVTDTSNATYWVNGATTMIVTAAGNALTYLAGDVFTVAGVYAVNPETKQTYAHLQQFVVRTSNVSAADGTFVTPLAIAPTIYVSGAKQNVSVTGAGSSALTNLTAGGGGAASAVLTQNLAYHRDAFTFVSADLHMEPGARMTRAVSEGISMRLWRGTDIVNDKFPSRLDVLFGYKTIRPEWANRTRG